METTGKGAGSQQEARCANMCGPPMVVMVLHGGPMQLRLSWAHPSSLLLAH